jgi:hypothetical protein
MPNFIVIVFGQVEDQRFLAIICCQWLTMFKS